MVHYRLTAALNGRPEIWYGVEGIEENKIVVQVQNLSQDSRKVRSYVQQCNREQRSPDSLETGWTQQ